MLSGLEVKAYNLVYEILCELLFNNTFYQSFKDEDKEKLANYFKRYATNIQTNGLIPTILFIYSKVNAKFIDTVVGIQDAQSRKKIEISDKTGALIVGTFFKKVVIRDAKLKKFYIEKVGSTEQDFNGLKLLYELSKNPKELSLFERKIKNYFKYAARLIDAKPESCF